MQLIDPLDVRLAAGDSMVITGPSGSGKTTLLGAWPNCGRSPRDRCATQPRRTTPCFVPAAVCAAGRSAFGRVLPAAAGDIDDTAIRAALDTVALGHLETRLDEVQDWAKVLSPGEQQRIAFARVLLTKPRAVFLDESTSALDEGQEFALYRALRTGCRTASWSASAIDPTVDSITTTIWNCWAAASGDSEGRSGGVAGACSASRRVLPARRPKNDPSPSWVPLA